MGINFKYILFRINYLYYKTKDFYLLKMNSHHKEDFRSKYKLIKKIGVGNFTDVYSAESKNKELRAIKIIRLGDIKLELEEEILSKEEINNKFNDFIKDLKYEIENMKICGENNENSVKYYESFETDEEFVIVMELADENLVKFKRNENLNSKEIYEILIQLNNTFRIMKEKNIVHRYLKPKNILIKYKNIEKKEEGFIVKLCDYGISKQTSQYTQVRTEKRGTKDYMAPEVIDLKKRDNYDYKCDLWSLGIIIYELFFGEVPYKGIYEEIMLGQINLLGKRKLKKTNDNNLDDLINGLLEKDPNKRMSWDEYLKHPFFNINKINIEMNNEIEIIIKVEKEEINKEIYYLDNTDYVDDFKVKHYHNNLKELNNVEVYINNTKYEYKKYFKPEKEGEFKIRIKFNDIKDCSFMFAGCKNIVEINFINFNTENIIDMKYMFTGCINLKYLDLSKFNTKNVTNMEGMFGGCINENAFLDASDKMQNIQNIEDMVTNFENLIIKVANYYGGCKNLEELKLPSSLNTQNVTNMMMMFFECNNLKGLNLPSSFNTQNVTNMMGMFSGCNNLKELNLPSSFNTQNVTNMMGMFDKCNNLKELNLPSSFNTQNVTNMMGMFYGCTYFNNFNLSSFHVIDKDLLLKNPNLEK